MCSLLEYRRKTSGVPALFHPEILKNAWWAAWVSRGDAGDHIYDGLDRLSSSLAGSGFAAEWNFAVEVLNTQRIAYPDEPRPSSASVSKLIIEPFHRWVEECGPLVGVARALYVLHRHLLSNADSAANLLKGTAMSFGAMLCELLLLRLRHRVVEGRLRIPRPPSAARKRKAAALSMRVSTPPLPQVAAAAGGGACASPRDCGWSVELTGDALSTPPPLAASSSVSSVSSDSSDSFSSDVGPPLPSSASVGINASSAP